MLLDSNILIYGASGEHPVLDEILNRVDLSAASVTQIETLGYHLLSDTEKMWLSTAFDRMAVLALDDAVTERAIQLRQLQKMRLADAVIAATALIHDLTLVTRNEDDFRNIPGLRILNPFASTR